MEPNEVQPPHPPRRKVKFAPKPPARKLPTAASAPKKEDGDAEDKEAQRLLRRFNESHSRERRKGEKKSTMQDSLETSSSVQLSGPSRDTDRGEGSNAELKDSLDDVEMISSLDATTEADGTPSDHIDSTGVMGPKNKKEYTEPWDYDHKYYPVSLPLRRPHLGDPEILNAAEFGEARKEEYDENKINPASDLGLLEKNEEQKMLFFKFPSTLPLVKRSATAKGKEKVGSSSSSYNPAAAKRGCSLHELPQGYMGKLLVYKSGKVKLKLGDTLYDVSPGSDCIFAQDIAAINTVEKHCCVLGEPGKRAVVTPDMDSLLDSQMDLG